MIPLKEAEELFLSMIIPPEFSISLSGEMRRKQPLVSQIDIVLTATKETPNMDWAGEWVHLYPQVAKAEIPGKIPIILYLTQPKAYGATLLLTTGPIDFNKALHKKAWVKDFQLSHRGLYIGDEQIDTGEEKNIFLLLDVPWMTPDQRTAFGSVDYQIDIIEREVTSTDGKTQYLVRIQGDRASCTCKGWEYRTSCRHVLRVRKDLGLPTPLRTARL